MPKFTLIGEHTDIHGKPDGTKVTYEFYVDGLNDVLEHVDLFIRGCGYNPTGVLDYVEDYFPDWVGQQDSEWHTEEFDTSVMDGHEGMGSTLADYELYDSTDVMSTKSKHYFDTERNK